MTLDKTEALSRWNRHLKKCNKNSESQKKRYSTKYLTAARKIREGLEPRDIQRETGISTDVSRKVQKMIAKGEI